MAKASFVVSAGTLSDPVEAQGHSSESALVDRYGVETLSEDWNMTQDLDDALRAHVVVEAPDPANVRKFVEEMYGNLLTDEIRHELDRQLG